MTNKQYNDFNKSVWFLFPLIAELSPKANRSAYLIDKYLINVFINADKKRVYVVYKNVPEVVDIEPLLTNNYLIDVEEYVTYTTYVYEISKPDYPEEGASPEVLIRYNNELAKYEEDLEVFNLFIQGKYSKLSGEYKMRVVRFFSLGADEYICRLFRRDEKLYHSVYKTLGCHPKGGTCTCRINTHVESKEVNGKTVRREVCDKKQEYSSCRNFKKFEMPDRLESDFELEEKPDLNQEAYYEPENI